MVSAQLEFLRRWPVAGQVIQPPAPAGSRTAAPGPASYLRRPDDGLAGALRLPAYRAVHRYLIGLAQGIGLLAQGIGLGAPPRA